jgi:hypothetical protein
MKAGVHLANDGNVTDEHLRLIANLRLVKGLVRLDVHWGEVDWQRLAAQLRHDCTVVLRLFFPGRLGVQEFLGRAGHKLPPILSALGNREVYIEIHNEPNHFSGIEGWGRTETQAIDFSKWYAEVRLGLRARGLAGKLGFPGLALGEWQHGERTWMRVNATNIRQSAWCGVHCYWQLAQHIEHPQLGGNWRAYRAMFPTKRLIATEVGNSGCQGPMGAPSPQEQARQYLEWCRSATGVYGAAFFILGGTQDWHGFQVHPETIHAIEEWQRR